MNIFQSLLENRLVENTGNRIYGVVIGIVTNNQDPEGLGRVKVKFPWLSENNESNWARIVAPMAGNGFGVYFLPEQKDEVLVAFEQGDLRYPFILGVLWNGQDHPPEKNQDGKNNIRVIKSRSGHTVRLIDEDGKEKIEIIDKSSKNSITIDTANNTIKIASDKDITLSASQGTITLDAQQIAIKSSKQTNVEATGKLALKANQTLDIKGTRVNIN
ncbi:MAG: phage baseplate assembly protein V [Acidobacteriota bacterium]